jgi:hypothetical protein
VSTGRKAKSQRNSQGGFCHGLQCTIGSNLSEVILFIVSILRYERTTSFDGLCGKPFLRGFSPVAFRSFDLTVTLAVYA